MPYVTDAVFEELAKRFGSDAVLKGGLRIQTTVDADFQRMAQETVNRWHIKLRGEGLYADQMALVAVDPRTHFVKALVGALITARASLTVRLKPTASPDLL
jgi:membrane peptidoglycan carboxypeptidase